MEKLEEIKNKISFILELIDEINSRGNMDDCEVVAIRGFLIKKLRKLYKEEKVFMEENK